MKKKNKKNKHSDKKAFRRKLSLQEYIECKLFLLKHRGIRDLPTLEQYTAMAKVDLFSMGFYSITCNSEECEMLKNFMVDRRKRKPKDLIEIEQLVAGLSVRNGRKTIILSPEERAEEAIKYKELKKRAEEVDESIIVNDELEAFLKKIKIKDGTLILDDEQCTDMFELMIENNLAMMELIKYTTKYNIKSKLTEEQVAKWKEMRDAQI